MAEQQAPAKVAPPKPDKAPAKEVTLRITDVLHHAVVVHGPADKDYPEGRPYRITPEGTPVPADLAEEFMHQAGRAGVSTANVEAEQAERDELAAREDDGE